MKRTHPEHRPFLNRLASFRRRWRWGLLAKSLLLILTLSIVLTLTYGMADWWLGFAVPMRIALTVVVGLLVLWVAVRQGVGFFGYSRFDAAQAADQAAGSRGRILSALELLEAKPVEAASPLQNYLVGKAVKAGEAMLGWHAVQAASPRKLIWKQAGWTLVALVLVFGLVSLNRPAASIVWHRLTHPTADLPPYSDLQFTVTPDQPAVIYGEDQLFECRIDGGKVDQEVTFLVRHPKTGQIESTPSFGADAQRFARKLENVTAPVAVAFAVGPARSAWQEVSVRYQPRILDATVRLVPPSYTKLSTRSSALGAEELQALTGTAIEAKLTSNRPLAGGSLKISPLGSTTSETISGQPGEAHEVHFKWTLQKSATLEFVLEDMLGTRTPQPLQIEQRAIPDQAPAVHIASPQPYALATARTKLPFVAEVVDDLGLAKVDLVRTLVGFRERSQAIARGEMGLRYDLEQPLDLGSLGVTEGQTLEFMLEASDANPSLLGVGTSEVVRVHIISDADYGSRIRMSTALAEFGERFNVLNRAIETARDATHAAQEAVPKGDAAALGAALQKADTAHGAAENVARALADDFQAYAMDRSLAETAAGIAKGMALNRADLESMAGASPERMEELLKKMMERLGGMREKAQAEAKKSEAVLELARLLEMAAKYQELLANQESIVRRMQSLLKEILGGVKANQAALEALGDTQQANADALREFGEELQRRAAALPPEQAELAQQSVAFAEALAKLQIPDAMDTAAQAARDARVGEALQGAELALNLMKRLLEEQAEQKNKFAGACQGKSPGMGSGSGSGGAQDANATLQQMLESMLARARQGQGQGQQPGGTGSGPFAGGGDSASGNWMAGQNLPMFGPNRTRFGPPSGQNQGGPSGPGRGQGKGPGGASTAARNSVSPDESQAAPQGHLKQELTPEGYRDAVKRYFSRTLKAPTKP